MAGPVNAAVINSVARKSFFDAVQAAANARFYPKIAMEVPQETITADYVSFGSVPEPMQISGSLAGGTVRSAAIKDYRMPVTALEWKHSANMPRSIAETNMAEVARVNRQFGQKAEVFFDRECVAALESTTTLGYDGVALFSGAHPESGTNQDNATTTNITTPSNPTAADHETGLKTAMEALRDFRDDQGTPVNEGVTDFFMLVSVEHEHMTHIVLDPTMSNQAVDSSGGTGRFRGRIKFQVSAYVDNDRFYLFALDAGETPLARIMVQPWDHWSNIGTDADSWRGGHLAIFNGYSQWRIVPWKWSRGVQHIYT